MAGEESKPAAPGQQLKEVGKGLMLLGIVGPAGLEAASKSLKGVAGGLLMIGTDLVRLFFFIGLACFLIGYSRSRQA